MKHLSSIHGSNEAPLYILLTSLLQFQSTPTRCLEDEYKSSLSIRTSVGSQKLDHQIRALMCHARSRQQKLQPCLALYTYIGEVSHLGGPTGEASLYHNEAATDMSCFTLALAYMYFRHRAVRV